MVLLDWKKRRICNYAETSAELDEAVWQAWIKKNKAQDKFRFARRLRAIFFVAALIMISAVWKFTI
jgi:hypothetical protein